MRLFLEKYRQETIILLLTIAVNTFAFCVLWLASQYNNFDYISPTGDSRAYVLLADNILSHGVFSLSETEPHFPESFRSPGYPLFLSVIFLVTFGNKALGLLLQSLILSFIPLSAYLLFRGLSSERVAWWSAIIFVFEPTRIFLSNSLLSDGLFALTLLTSLLMYFRYLEIGKLGLLLISGVLLGFSILIRPIAMFLPLILLVHYFWMRSKKEDVLRVLCFVGVITVIVFPWMLRNKIYFNSWQISSVGSFNLAYYNAQEFLRYRGVVPAEIQEVVDDLKVSIVDHRSLSLANSNYFSDAAFKIIMSDPLGYTKFHLVKIVPFFVTDGLREIARTWRIIYDNPLNISSAIANGNWGAVGDYLLSFDTESILFFAGTTFWGVVTMMTFLAIFKDLLNWKNLNYRHIFLYILIFYFAFLTGPVANARYRFPVSMIMIFVVINLSFNLGRHNGLLNSSQKI